MSNRHDRDRSYDERRSPGASSHGQQRHKRRPSPDVVPAHSSRRRRDRSRSRSPSPSMTTATNNKEKQQLEAARRSRMARLRAENEAEEQRLAALEEQQQAALEGREKGTDKPGPQEAIVQVNEEELEGLDEEEQMKLLLGFGGGFGSTKNEKVEDNFQSSARGAAAKHKARKYRQYMNRKNGFNRPLDKMD